jgi:RNA polymerase sigma-70 factor (ECF subfamily)
MASLKFGRKSGVGGSQLLGRRLAEPKRFVSRLIQGGARHALRRLTALHLISGTGWSNAPNPEDQPTRDAQVLRDLVGRAQHGDVAAFERLIAAHERQVYAFALAFAGDPDQAKDLAQEALVKSYRSIGSFRFQSSFSTWLYAIVRNLFRDQLRGRAANESLRGRPLRDADLQLASEDAAGADEQLIAEESRQALLAALGRVPDPYREALFLADVQGQGYQDIAAVLRVAVGTVKSRVNRGREALRAILFENGEKETMR